MAKEFTKGACYKTSYGDACVVRKHGRTAEFKVRKPSAEARRMGWKPGMSFLAHPEDRTSPSPKTWARIKKTKAK